MTRSFNDLNLDLVDLQARIARHKDGHRKDVARECADLARDKLVDAQMGYAPAITEALLQSAHRAMTRAHVNLNMGID